MAFKIYDSAHLPVIAHLCDRLKITEIADKSLPWDNSQWEISPGTVIKGILIDALNGRSPLYRMNEFFEATDTEQLLGQGVKAAHFNDDRLDVRWMSFTSMVPPNYLAILLSAPSMNFIWS